MNTSFISQIVVSCWCWNEINYFFFQTQNQFFKNNSILWKKTGNCFHSFMSYPTTWKRVSKVLFDEILSRFNISNVLFFFNPSTRWTQPSSPKLLLPVWCWNATLFCFFQTQIQFLKNNSFLGKKTWNWFHSFGSD